MENRSFFRPYAIFQFLLVVAHYVTSILIIYNTADKFTVPWKFQWNSWTPLRDDTGGTGACSKGCLIGEETYIFDGGDRLNVSFIVAAFGLISGTNHLLQLLLFWMKDDRKIEELLRNNTLAIIRNLDFAFSAPLMLICSSILFNSPPDAQLLLFVFGFQFMVQLAGYSCEVIKQDEENDGASKAMPIFYTAAALYVLPWAYQMTVLYYGGALADKLSHPYEQSESALINYPKALKSALALLNEVKDGTQQLGGGGEDITLSHVYDLMNEVGLEPAAAPVQVYFFLSWLFLSFGLFPLALYFKLNEPQSNGNVQMLAVRNFRYEIIYSVLSFLSKLPLQYFFFLGSFQREKFAPVGEELNVKEDDDFDNRVLLNAVVPAGVCTLLGLLALWVFRAPVFNNTNEKLRCLSGTVGVIFVSLVCVVAIFIPLFIVMGQSAGNGLLDPLTGLNLISLASFAFLIVGYFLEKR